MPAAPQVPASDWLLGGFLLMGMILLLAITERFYRLYPQRAETLRKFIHIATGIAVLPARWLFTSWLPIFIITMFFALANFWSIQRGKLKSIHAVSRPSFGTVYYPLSFAILLLAFWDWNVMVLSISFALMAFADAVAGIVAGKISNRKILPLPWDTKSLQGSAAMFVCSALIIGIGLILFGRNHDLSWQNGFIISIAIGLFATAAEALSYRGSDNLTIPLLAALGLYVILQPEMQQQFLLGEILALIITSLAFAAKALDLSGAIAAFLVGTIIFGIGGWTFAAPMLVFFIGSSLLSRIAERGGKVSLEMMAKSGRRDAAQVLANGLLPTLVVITSLFIQKDTAYLLYLGGIAAATADTWATEIGLLFGKQPRSILNGKKVAAGTSGGITMAGVVGAILGAAAIALAGEWGYRTFEQSEMIGSAFIGIAIAGVIAQFVDSLLGATVQRRNQCAVCGKITERDKHCGQPTNYFSGWWWLDNDGVNIACGISGILLVAVETLWF